MHDGAERIDLLALNQDIDLDQISRLFAVLMVIERSIALGTALELVEEIEHDFGQWNTVMHFDAFRAQIFHIAHLPAMFLAQIHYRADEFLRRDDIRGDHGFDDFLDFAFGEFARIGDMMHGAVLRRDLVRYARRGGDQVEPEFTFQALADDFHMQQAEEPATEAESQGDRGLGLINERGVVEFQFVKCVTQFRELRVVDWEQAGVHHRLGVPVAWQWFARRFESGRNCVADLRLADVLGSGDDVSDLACPQRLGGRHVWADDADFDGVVCHTDAHHVKLLARFQLAVHHTDVRDDAAVGVVDGIEDECAGWRLGVAMWCGHVHDDGVEQIGDAFAGLAGHPEHILGLAPDEASDFLGVFVGFRAGQVNLVEYGDDGQVVVNRHIQVGQGLRFDALRGIHQQHRALTSRQSARNLIGEIHMAGCVDHAEGVFRAVDGPRHADGLRLDGNAAFLLDIHTVEETVVHFTLRDDAGQLEDSVGDGGFAVVDMRDDAEVADQRLIGIAGFVLRFNH